MARLSTFRPREDKDYVSILHAPMQLTGEFLFRRPVLEQYLRSFGVRVGEHGFWGTVVLKGRNGRAEELNLGGTQPRVFTEEEFWQTFFWVGERVGERYVPGGLSISRRNHLFCAAPPLARLVIHGHVSWEKGKAHGHTMHLLEINHEMPLKPRWRAILKESRDSWERTDGEKLSRDRELDCLLDVV